jgi:hypothetical protein
MTSRRQFLQTGIAASALPLSINALLSPSPAAAGSQVARVSLYKAIFDGRYAEGQTFARQAAGFRVPVHSLPYGDVTEIYDELDVLWRKERVAIAGLTQFGPMFVLERLARERGLQVALRVEHQVRADGTLAHVVSAHPETAALAEQLSVRGVDWPTSMAMLASHCRDHDAAAATKVTILTPGAQPVMLREPGAQRPESIIHYYVPALIQAGQGVPLEGPLFSWVITPAARARRA